MNTHVELLKTGTIGFKVYTRHQSDDLVPWRYANREDTTGALARINLAPETNIRSYACYREVTVDTAAEAAEAALDALDNGQVVVRIAAVRPVAPEFREEHGPTFRDYLTIGELMCLVD